MTCYWRGHFPPKSNPCGGSFVMRCKTAAVSESQISCRKWCGPSIWNVFAENLQTKKIVPLRPRASVLSREVIISPDRPLSFQSTSLSEHLLYCVSPLSPFFFPTKPTQAQASKPRFLGSYGHWPRLAGSAYSRTTYYN